MTESSKDMERGQVEALEDLDSRYQAMPEPRADVSGTVKLFSDSDASVVLIPTPSPDPKDPLNLPTWQKNIIILVVGLYSAFSVLGTSALGSVVPEVSAMYHGDPRVNDLLTYPTLFMGIGNLLAMPLCVAVGRRPVFLFSLLLLCVTSVWCACSGSLGSHIAGRDIFSMAAGQSEALSPFIIEEIHFLHERGTKLAWFVGVQTIGTAAMFVATTYIVPSLGLRWWYGIIAIVSSAVLLLAVAFVVETRYDRPSDANQGAVHLKAGDDEKEGVKGIDVDTVFRVTTRQNHVLEPEKFGSRTWRHDLKLFHGRPEWNATRAFYRESAKGLCLPTIFWLLLLNGAFLGVYVFQASTFANILMAPPYDFNVELLGYVQLVQVLEAVLLIPVLGYGSDFLVKTMSRWKHGVFQPEYRLISLAIPGICVILSCVLYGQAGAFPYKWHWMTVVAPYHLGYFAFLGANLIGITYAIDSFPSKAGPLLLVICAGRGFISFGLSYSTLPFIAKAGYNGSMNVFAIVCGLLSGLGIPAYFFGGAVRRWATRHFWPAQAE